MNIKNIILSILTLIVIITLFNFMHNRTESSCPVTNLEELAALFPKTVSQIESMTEKLKKDLEYNLNKFLNSSDTESFALYDQITKPFNQTVATFKALEMVSPQEEIRDAAYDASLDLVQFVTNKISYNQKVYQKLKSAIVKENLQYSLEDEITDFEKNGINLPDETRAKLEKLQNELSELTSSFDYAIAQDTPVITVTEAEKKELPENIKEFIEEDKITLIPPVVSAIMSGSTVGSVRQKTWQAFLNRAPENDARIKEIIKKRDQKAKMLGFKNYAAYDLEDQMVKNPETAHKFLVDLIKPVQAKTDLEFKRLSQELPAGVIIENDKFKPWDISFTQEQYRQKHLKINQEEIAKYFELKPTLAGLLNIYENFFNIKFKEIDDQDKFWDKDVRVLEIYEKDFLAGYILLDLYPRPNKYSHACNLTVVSAYKDCPEVGLVIANFPKPTADKPALLKYRDVVTFFHEFGHALHSILGRTEISFKSGTNVKHDFVEMPSQMLEIWLKEPKILKSLARHYQTGEALPDELITSISELEKFDAGFDTSAQLYYALLALTLFEGEEITNLQEHAQKLYSSISQHIQYVPNNFINSFGHLTGYGSKYYGYLWSKVFAADLFDTIKKAGLGSDIGEKYKEIILRPGGTKDPELMLEEFLGRKPSSEAFFAALGIEK